MNGMTQRHVRGGLGRRGGRAALVVALGALTMVVACGRDRSEIPSTSSFAPAASAHGGGADASKAPAPAARPRVVILGDSISAGLGISPTDAFPGVLQRKVDQAGLNFEIVNAGVSGDTSAGGVRRLDWALDGDVKVLVLELGANDGLRGLPVSEMTRNLGAIIERARARGITVLLLGMEAPPNFGPVYTSEFRMAFKTLADEHRVPFVPFLLSGVAGLPALNQADGVHPNAEGARMVADTVWATLQPLLAVDASS